MTAGNHIRAGYALPGPGVPSDAPAYDYSALLGRTGELRPSGENSRFDKFLPRHGRFIRQVALADWGSDWLVFELAEPFSYEETSVSYCIIRARWTGCPIGSEFCPVFVLTDNRHALSMQHHWSSKDFQFTAWAEVSVSEA
jgi:hypothetical protein